MATQERSSGPGTVYRESGRGAPLVFVHGNAGDGRVWEAQFESAAGNRRCIAPTLRYFGREPWPDKGEGYSAATHVGDLAALIAGLGAGPADLVGWSYGAALSLQLAVQRPDLVGSLFLFEPAVAGVVTDPAAAESCAEDRKAMAGAALAAAKEGDCAAALSLLVDGANGQPGSFAAFPDAIRVAALDSARVLPLAFAVPPAQISCAELGRITAPTLVVRGELTRLFYRLVAEAVGRCVPGARLAVAPRARHFWPVEDPAGFGRMLRDFLDQAR